MNDSINKKIIMIDGGLGRVIALTGVITEYAKRNPELEINILTPYPELFYNNPYIKKCYSDKHPYIFEDVIKNMDYIEIELYKDYDFYSNKKHIIEVYSKLLLGKSEFINPQIFLLDSEIQEAKEYFEKTFKKPVIYFQPFGSTGGKLDSFKLIPDYTGRSLEYKFAEKIIESLKDKFDIVQIRSPNQKAIDSVCSLLQSNGEEMPIRKLIASFKFVTGIITCDSMSLHIAKLLNKSNVIVFWGASYPSNFGYQEHNNFVLLNKFYWQPLRLISNNFNRIDQNKDIMKEYNDEHINKLIETANKWILID